MTKDEFTQRIIAMTDVLYRIAWSQLRQAADREDAVQETIRRARQQKASGRVRRLAELRQEYDADEEAD